MPKDTLTIQNGKVLKTWLWVIGTMVGTVITASLLWSQLCERVNHLEKSHQSLSVGGSVLAHMNKDRLIRIEMTVKSTEKTLDKVAKKLNVL